MHRLVEILPHVNASLNALATVLLIVGYALIKGRRERAHQWVMLSCFGVSVLFLSSYLTYHSARVYLTGAGHTAFPADAPSPARYAYYGILISHVILAATVPFLAVATIWLGLRGRRAAHVRLARVTFPVWFYVSITGVIVYLMLYQIYAPGRENPIIERNEPVVPHTFDADRAGRLPAAARGPLGLPKL